MAAKGTEREFTDMGGKTAAFHLISGDIWDAKRYVHCSGMQRGFMFALPGLPWSHLRYDTFYPDQPSPFHLVCILTISLCGTTHLSHDVT